MSNPQISDQLKAAVRDGVARAAGVVGLAGIGLIHLLDLPTKLTETPYLVHSRARPPTLDKPVLGENPPIASPAGQPGTSSPRSPRAPRVPRPPSASRPRGGRVPAGARSRPAAASRGSMTPAARRSARSAPAPRPSPPRCGAGSCGQRPELGPIDRERSRTRRLCSFTTRASLRASAARRQAADRRQHRAGGRGAA
jgi:hypothetical protein